MDKECVSIYKVKKHKGSYLVFTSYQNEPFKFSLDLIVSHRLTKGRVFFKSEFEAILDELNFDVYYNKILLYIDYQFRTEYEIRTRLKNLNASIEQIENVVNKLTSKGLINDSLYAKLKIEQKLLNEYGPNHIEYDLISKGISKDIFKDMIPCDEKLYYENALNLSNKTLKTLVGLPINKQKESIRSRLLRMGYNLSTIDNVLDNLTYSNVDLNRLQTEYDKLLLKKFDNEKIINKLLIKGYDYSDIINIINIVKDAE